MRSMMIKLCLLAMSGVTFGCVAADEEDSPLDDEAPDSKADGIGLTKQGDHRVYFTNPINGLIAMGDFKGTERGITTLAATKVGNGTDLDKQVIALINRAKGHCSVLLADYDFNLQSVADALVRAKGRGCDVRMITDGDTLDQSDPDPNRPHRKLPFNPIYEQPFKTLKAGGVDLRSDGTRGAIMHDKFVVVNHQAVWMGSWNMAVDDLNGFWNNAMDVVSTTMADRYAQTFEMMWDKFDPENPQKDGNIVNHDIMLGTLAAQVYFPSEDHTTDAIVKAVQTARTSIHFLAFSFTSQPIGDAILAKYGAGVEVGGVFESRGACSSQYKPMAAKGMNVVRWQHDYHHYMHEKVIVIDSKTVVFGSFNFSDNADHGNDENVIIVTDPTMAAMFEKEYKLVDSAARAKAPQPACP